MNSITRGTPRARRRIGLLLACFISVPAFAAAQDVNVVKGIRAVDSTVEIELESSKEFPVRDEIVVLRIGKKEFSKSRSPKNGSLKGLIFILTADEFARLGDGEIMTVGFGRQSDSEDTTIAAGRDAGLRWEFGKLNKGLLER